MKENNKITLDSKIKDLYATVVGHDALAKVLLQQTTAGFWCLSVCLSAILSLKPNLQYRY